MLGFFHYRGCARRAYGGHFGRFGPDFGHGGGLGGRGFFGGRGVMAASGVRDGHEKHGAAGAGGHEQKHFPKRGHARARHQ